MKALLTACIAFLSLPAIGLKAQEWIDITGEYLKNPGFDNNSNAGWTYTNVSSTQCTYEAMEFWQGTFDIYQTVEVPNGKYRVSVQAYFRTKDNNAGYSEYTAGTEDITGYLYANNDRTKLTSIYAYSLSENYAGGCWSSGGWGTNRKYFPNNMQTGSYMFGLGMYNNSIETQVTNGKLKLGLINEEWVSNNWCMFDNFKLEYYGTVIPVEKITLSASSQELIKGETVTLKYTLSPANATYKGVTWKSANTAVASVDENGCIRALSEGTTTITATAKNGTATARCTVSVTNNPATAASLIINEIQSSNVDMFVDPSFNYGGWIELYNPTDKPVSIQGFHVSKDPLNLKMYRLTDQIGVVPAKGYKNIWFDHYEADTRQVDFKLDCDGGVIYISDENGIPVTLQSYPAAISRTSYARTKDGGNTWGITAQPTPEKSNATSLFASQRLAAPVPDQDTQIFASELTVNVEKPAGSRLVYTTDGTTPTEHNGTTSTDGRFNVTRTSVYRFRVFQDGMLPSEVVTRTYIYKDKNYDLPVISVVTDPVNLYDDSLGVYVKGVNGRRGNGQSDPCNWNMEWDRPVNFEYLTQDGQMAVNQEADFAMCGGWSRAWTPHSFKIKADKTYEGRNSLDYPFFADKPYLKHKTLQIRNGGNDTGCRIKDAALQSIISTSGLNADYQAYQPVMHFINGQYTGVINMREPNNKHFAYANYGWDSEEIDQFEMSPDSGYCQKCGTKNSFMKWYDLSANAADEATYAEIRNMVDIDEYINYMATEFYLGATDWPQNNIKGFRPKTEDGKFRFVLFDLDGTFATTDPFNVFANKQTHRFDKLYDQPVPYWEKEIEMVTIFLNMLENESFRKQFVDSYCLVAGSVFEPGRCTEIIDSLTAKVTDMMAYEGRSPYSTANSLKSGLSNRQGTMINALKNYSKMQLGNATEYQVQLSANIPYAHLSVNDLPVPTNSFNGSLFSPVTVKAQAPANYRFSGWKQMKQNNAALFEKGSAWEYYDQGSLDGEQWYAQNYSGTWSSGKAPLGYDTNGQKDISTQLDYGTSASNKRPTYYFRKTFRLTATPTESDVFTLDYVVDDGIIVYVNGQEAARYNMPSGSVSYNTYATTYAHNNPDQGTLTLPAGLFKWGTNTITVELHNNNASSTDVYWDAALYSSANTKTSIVSTEETYTLSGGSTFDLQACYEPLSEEELNEQGILPVRINEVSADNSIYVNDLYKKNDWVELYNTTDQPIDVAGMFISDNALIPAKYQISAENTTAETVIAPHGYLVIWCDKLTPVSQLHATFKLAKEGGDVLLTAADQSWSDKLTYPAHEGKYSVGLYPDGGSNHYIMNLPSIGASNVMNGYAQFFENIDTPDCIEENKIEEDSMYIAYRNGMLLISGHMTYVTVSVHTPSAQMCMQERISLNNGQALVNLGNLSKGIYLATVRDDAGRSKTIKILKN